MTSLVCEECDRDFSTKGNLQRHWRMFHEEEDEEDSEEENETEHDSEEESETEDEDDEDDRDTDIDEDENSNSFIVELIVDATKDMDGITDWQSLITYDKYGRVYDAFKEMVSQLFTHWDSVAG